MPLPYITGVTLAGSPLFSQAFTCGLEIVDDLDKGEYDEVKFYDSFKLKRDEDGDWTLRQDVRPAPASFLGLVLRQLSILRLP